MKAQYLFSAGVFVALAVACGVEVNIEGKPCPCTTGYTCDPVRQVCVRPDAVTKIVDGGATVPACDPCTCEVDADCKDPTRPACGPAKLCVQCNPGPNDKCNPGSYCNAKNQCTIGCRSDDDCGKLVQGSPICNLERHVCVECKDDTQCGGNKCTQSGTCAKVCTGKADCTVAGQDCCDKLCIDVTKDTLNCGSCGKACTVENGTAKCSKSACAADCADGFATCPGGPGACLTQLRNDAMNCGSCGNDCSKLQHVENTSCLAGHCHFEKCADGWLNLNNNADDGCEVQCGAANGSPCCQSGTPCVGSLKCNGGTCRGNAGG